VVVKDDEPALLHIAVISHWLQTARTRATFDGAWFFEPDRNLVAERE
jgi:hypothetical protein